MNWSFLLVKISIMSGSSWNYFPRLGGIIFLMWTAPIWSQWCNPRRTYSKLTTKTLGHQTDVDWLHYIGFTVNLEHPGCSVLTVDVGHLFLDLCFWIRKRFDSHSVLLLTPDIFVLADNGLITAFIWLLPDRIH